MLAPACGLAPAPGFEGFRAPPPILEEGAESVVYQV